jgi:protein-S-isoprenylcysteine O-methyltransferase Ste14
LRSIHTTAIHVISDCWAVFAVVWLFAACMTKPSVYRESTTQRLRYIAILFFGCFLMFQGHRLGYPLGVRVIPQSDAVGLASAILCVTGLIFCLWARATLGRNWSGTITLKEAHELIVRGPYRLVRHPIYTGLLAMIIATVAVTGHLAGMIGGGLAFVSFWIKLRDEEAVMLQQFPDEYSAYRQRVKRIIPFIL